MAARTRNHLFAVLRAMVCLVALWLVARGVTVHDVVTRVDGTKLRGEVQEAAETVTVVLASGEQKQFPLAEVARESDGSPRIVYGLRTAWRTCRVGLLILAVLVHFPVGFLQAWRIQFLLAAQNIPMTYWECVKLSFAGNFLNFATPLGSNAGDVFKAYFVSLHTSRKTEAVTTVVLDRVIGLGTLILVVATITVLSPPGGRLGPFRNYLLTILVVGAAGTIAYFSTRVRRILPRDSLRKLPGSAQLQRVDQAARTLAARKWIVAGCVLITAALQAMAMGAYFVVARAMGLEAHAGNLLEYYAYFATGAVIQALPGPPQGLGTVELAYRYFLAPFGSPSQIVCFALAARLVVLVCALPGALVAATGSYRPRESGSELQPSALPRNAAP